MGLLSIIIKKLVLSGYNPAEDLLELGVDVVAGKMRPNDENIDIQMKAAGLTKDQIKAAKVILAESADRFILNTPVAIYEKKADAISISRQVFKAFIDAQESEEESIEKRQLRLGDEYTKEQIIKGITIIVQKALNVYLDSPEYTEYLSKRQKKIDEQVAYQDNQLKDHEKRIAKIEINRNQSTLNKTSNIEAYYDYVKGLYTKHYKGNTLLGEESLSELYMQPFYYVAKEVTGDVEQLVEEFCSKGESGVLWIVGEPGHGKTSMCIKAVSDYVNKKYYKSVSGVFWFRLNPQGTTGMVTPKTLVLEKVFSWGRITGNRSNMIEPGEIEGSLVFLDGFDELKSSLEEHAISSNQFYEQVNQMAQEYKMHIVITSRTRALEQKDFCTEFQLSEGDVEITCNLSDGGVLRNNVLLLSPLTEEKQTAWLNGLISLRENKGIDTSDLENYKHTFQALQENEDIAGLLKVPILLRMIVQNCFEPSSDNRVELYRELFDKTLSRQGLGDQRERLHSIYQEIAFRIFVYDDDCAEINKADFKGITDSDACLYQYYLHTPKVESGQDKANIYRITFIHRSFYQYFLSEFYYEKLKAVTDGQSGEYFLKYLWPRHMDPYVLDNLRLIAKNEYIDYKQIIKAIDETDAILSEYKNSSSSKENIGNYDKAHNTFWNAISACNSVFQVVDPQKRMELTGRVIELFSKYTCSGILLRKAFLNRAYLREADLGEADLRGADLGEANLTRAKLRNADLRDANLPGANLYGADLRGADLKGADLRGADLSEAKLSEADLRQADLRGADLRGADLGEANLSEANLIGANLIGANLPGAKLRNADLRDANLIGANLSIADLSRADLREVVLIDTIMDNADVENAKVLSQQYEYVSRANVRNLDKIIVIDD